MLATPGSYEFHRRQPGSPWLSAGVSIAITAGLFAAALLSMKSAPAWMYRRAADEAPAVMVRLVPPVVRRTPAKVVPPKIVPHARVSPPAAAVGNSTIAPASIPVGVPMPSARGADTTVATSPRVGPPIAAGEPTTSTGLTRAGGAPVAPAGVTGQKSAPLTADDLTSLRTERLQSIVDLARTYVPTAEEASDLQLDKRRAEQIDRRVSTAGNSRDVHIPTGDGLGGAGVAGGGLSSGTLASGRLPLAILEPGPSPEQRKRDAAIDAEYRARLARLQARVVAKRDSIRADSLRRDSLARKGVVP